MVIAKKLLTVAAVIASLASSMNLGAMKRTVEANQLPDSPESKYLLVRHAFDDTNKPIWLLSEISLLIMECYADLIRPMLTPIIDEIADLTDTKKKSTSYSWPPIRQAYPSALIGRIEKLAPSCDSNLLLTAVKLGLKKGGISLETYVDFDNRTALIHAIYEQRPDMVTLILDAAGDNAQALITMRTHTGNSTALHDAAEFNKRAEIIELLLDGVGDDAQDLIAMVDGRNRTALHGAAFKGYFQNAKLLLEFSNNKQALITARDNKGNTPLHIAARGIRNHAEGCEEGYPQIITLLLKCAGKNAQALAGMRNNQGQTAYDCAQTHEIQEILHKFLQPH